MNISVPSRFACLKVEEEEPEIISKKPIDKKKIEKPQEKKFNKDVKKGKQVGTGRKEKKVKQQTAKQWEEWKQKDDQFVNGHYEQDLESAILLSKLHYEENKDKYDAKINNNNKKPDKKKKNKAMSLIEFLAENNDKGTEIQVKNFEKDGNFFDKVQKETKKEITKDNLSEQRREREESIEEIISSAQFKEKLEIERKKNMKLEKELKKAKEEAQDVKSRNQILCTMISTGEMKGKAEVLQELEKLTTIKNDLTEEVTRLHGLLEQERSKVAALTNDKHKEKKSRKHV